ncbi:MAG: tetR2 [Aeromicrobium sp.]|nr:tetR2 [Aeromicrobium sp.]
MSSHLMVFNEDMSTPRSERTRGGRQPDPLSTADVVRAGLRFVERHGLDRLTIKGVADELGVTSPAVYHHVTGKDDLVERICGMVTAEVSLDVGDSLDWQEQVETIVVGMHRTYARYPGVGERSLRFVGPARAPETIAGRIIDIVVAEGFAVDSAVRLITTLQLVVAGWLLQQVTYLPEAVRPPAPDSEEDVLRTALRTVLTGFEAVERR